MSVAQLPAAGVGARAPLDSARVWVNPLARAPLGHIAKYAAARTTPRKTAARPLDRSEVVRRRFARQDVARRLIPHERVARCCRWVRKGWGGVEVLHSAAEGRAHLAGVEVCSSVWLCPVCAVKIAEGRRADLVQAVTYWRAAGGGSILFATFTARHHRDDALSTLLERFLAAYRRMTGHRAYRRLFRPGRGAQGASAPFALVGSVRALEVTHGERNGWHPHCHVLLFFDRQLGDDEVSAITAALRSLWQSAAAAEGLDLLADRGVTVERTWGAIADYVAKYGRDPEIDPWGPESELTKAHVKTGRPGRSTPWDLLARAGEGDGRAAHLFREYAECFKGRQQLVWSPHFRALVGLEDDAPSDQALAAARPADAVHLGWLSLSEWLLVLRYDARADVLNAAAGGDWSAVLALVRDLRRRRAEDRRRRGLDPPPIAPPLPAAGVLPRQATLC